RGDGWFPKVQTLKPYDLTRCRSSNVDYFWGRQRFDIPAFLLDRPRHVNGGMDSLGGYFLPNRHDLNGVFSCGPPNVDCRFLRHGMNIARWRSGFQTLCVCGWRFVDGHGTCGSVNPGYSLIVVQLVIIAPGKIEDHGHLLACKRRERIEPLTVTHSFQRFIE